MSLNVATSVDGSFGGDIRSRGVVAMDDSADDGSWLGPIRSRWPCANSAASARDIAEVFLFTALNANRAFGATCFLVSWSFSESAFMAWK